MRNQGSVNSKKCKKFIVTKGTYWSVSEVVYNPVNSCINAFAYHSIDYQTHSAANLLTELLMLKDHELCFSNGISLSHDDLNDIIINIREI